MILVRTYGTTDLYISFELQTSTLHGIDRAPEVKKPSVKHGGIQY